MSKLLGERNIEVKVRIGSDDEFEKKKTIAERMTLCGGKKIMQRDVFLHSKTGRFKLRYIEGEKSQLLYYDRRNVEGPKLSNYIKIEIDEPEKFENIFLATNGVLGVLKKQRFLFLYKSARIHLDKVEQLGNYLEIEVCLASGETLEEGNTLAKTLMEIFDVNQKDLISGSYFDIFCHGNVE